MSQATTLTFDALSSAAQTVDPTIGGERDVAVDLSDYLESGESLATAVPTSGSSTVLEIDNIAINGNVVSWHETVVLLNAVATVDITIPLTGDSGSADTHHCQQPIKKYLTE